MVIPKTINYLIFKKLLQVRTVENKKDTLKKVQRLSLRGVGSSDSKLGTPALSGMIDIV